MTPHEMNTNVIAGTVRAMTKIVVMLVEQGALDLEQTRRSLEYFESRASRVDAKDRAAVVMLGHIQAVLAAPPDAPPPPPFSVIQGGKN